MKKSWHLFRGHRVVVIPALGILCCPWSLPKIPGNISLCNKASTVLSLENSAPCYHWVLWELQPRPWSSYYFSNDWFLSGNWAIVPDFIHSLAVFGKFVVRCYLWIWISIIQRRNIYVCFIRVICSSPCRWRRLCRQSEGWGGGRGYRSQRRDLNFFRGSEGLKRGPLNSRLFDDQMTHY